MRPRLRSWDGAVEGMGWLASLGLVPALLHARALAEILIAGIDVLFLAHAWAMRDTGWLRRRFTWAAGSWWLWLVLCSALNGGGLLPGLLAVRLPLLSLALASWILQPAARRRWLWIALAAAFAWIAAECWQQYLRGHNLFGQARWGDGALTGPFNKPRAGPAFILLFFPVVVPAVMARFALGTRRGAIQGGALLAGSVLTMLLIGQRMPSVLMVLGLAATALLLPGLRRVVMLAMVAGALLVIALPVVSPAANDKLVVQTREQIRHFSDSDYGLIFARAWRVARSHPWTGLGFDGFRRDCADLLRIPRIVNVLPPANVRACNLHPHNYYLEAADDAGWLGLASFAVMVAVALGGLGGGLWRRAEPLRVGVFVGALVALWPAASTSAFTSMPNGGWVFLVLGLGFASQGSSPFLKKGTQKL